jgi:hypothetical protein
MWAGGAGGGAGATFRLSESCCGQSVCVCGLRSCGLLLCSPDRW